MKRGRTRPDPVSCQSCRSKKLKCNRIQPCSNCSARGINCSFIAPPQRETETTSTINNLPEILGRIERLESIVLQNVPVEAYSKDALNDEHRTRRQAFTSDSEDAISDIHRKRDEDSQLLESIGTRDDSLLPSLSHGLTFRISSTSKIIGKQQLSKPVSYEYRPNDIIVTFPDYQAAILLFESYESSANHMCRILHIPTIRSLIKTLYARISQNELVPLGQAALLLSLFALAAFFYQPVENSEVATTEKDAVSLSEALSKGALDVLDHPRRNTSGTLEDVQAYILMSFVTFHLDGFSTRGRLLSTAAVTIARDLRMHRLDAAHEHAAERELTVRVLIDHEIKRRVFWHVASSDWLYSTISGPQEGMYFIHPNHVNVNLPKDCLDDDTVAGHSNGSAIEPPPNGITFFLERIRLAHLCRESADIVPLETSKLIQMPYEHIIALDKKLEEFIMGLPFFLRLDSESREKSQPLETIYPHIPVMRCSITHAAHSRRCKLHQKFLLRQSSNPSYSYSRRACLESARAVIRAYEDLPGRHSQSYVTARMGMAIHYTHLALVVMVMDLCFNKYEADEAEIKADVRTALKKFEDTRGISPLAGRFLSSLCDILRKHKVYLTNSPTLTPSFASGSAGITRPGAMDFVHDEQMQFNQSELGIYGSNVSLDASFDEFWQFATSEPNLDSMTWDNLFSALDSRPI